MRSILSFSVVTALGMMLLPVGALDQQAMLKDQIAGTWRIVSNDNTAPDGTRRQLFGANPKGLLVLAANGQYVQIFTRGDVPKFKNNNRLEGTPEETTAAYRGTVATFGTWSVDEAGKVLITRIDGSLFPNQVGMEQRRSISLTGDDLTVDNPAPAAGGKSQSVWKRIK
jgi:hypothetical protein